MCVAFTHSRVWLVKTILKVDRPHVNRVPCILPPFLSFSEWEYDEMVNIYFITFSFSFISALPRVCKSIMFVCAHNTSTYLQINLHDKVACSTFESFIDANEGKKRRIEIHELCVNKNPRPAETNICRSLNCSKVV